MFSLFLLFVWWSARLGFFFELNKTLTPKCMCVCIDFWRYYYFRRHSYIYKLYLAKKRSKRVRSEVKFASWGSGEWKFAFAVIQG